MPIQDQRNGRGRAFVRGEIDQESLAIGRHAVLLLRMDSFETRLDLLEIRLEKRFDAGLSKPSSRSWSPIPATSK